MVLLWVTFVAFDLYLGRYEFDIFVVFNCIFVCILTVGS